MTENITDRHDESDATQFGDDTPIANTPFTNSHCTTCGTYVVHATTYPGQPLCIDCRRTQTGVTWPSGDNLGTWHPTTPITPQDTPHHQHDTPTQAAPRPWAWACIHCREQGTALNADHAASMHRIHLGFACPCAPNLTPTETQLRLGRRTALSALYPHLTPPMHYNTTTRRPEFD